MLVTALAQDFFYVTKLHSHHELYINCKHLIFPSKILQRNPYVVCSRRHKVLDHSLQVHHPPPTIDNSPGQHALAARKPPN